MKELKAVEILTIALENAKLAMKNYEHLSDEIPVIKEALTELQELTKEKSCVGCEYNQDTKREQGLIVFQPKCYICSRNTPDKYTPKG